MVARTRDIDASPFQRLCIMVLSRLLRKLSGRKTPIHSSASATSVPDTDADVRQAQHAQWLALSNQGRFHEAVELCLKDVGTPIDDNRATSFLGYAYFQLTNYELALQYLEKAVRENSGDYYSTFFLGRTYQALAQKEKALEMYMVSCTTHPAQKEEVLTFALPLAFEVQDSQAFTCFSETFQTWIEQHAISNQLLEKYLFFKRDDAALLEQLAHASSTTCSRLRRIRSVASYASEGNVDIHIYGAPPAIRIVTPATDGSDRYTEVSTQANAPYVARVPNALICSGSSLISVEENVVLSDLMTDPDYGKYVSQQYDRTVIAQRPDALLMHSPLAALHLPEGIFLSGLASNQFGHWFAEFLPKLRHFQAWPACANVPIIVDEGMPASHYEFLKTLAANPLYLLPQGAALQVDHLWVAPTTTFFPVELVPNHRVPPERQAAWTTEAFRFIKAGVERSIGMADGPRNRIFLSRKNSVWRRLVNEAELISTLEPLGFVSVCLEEHDFKEQVRLFQTAEFIVAPNGSALNSLIFSPPDTKALIIGQENVFNWGGWLGPIMDLGFAPRFLSGAPIGDHNNKQSDYVVSASQVCQVVSDMLHA